MNNAAPVGSAPHGIALATARAPLRRIFTTARMPYEAGAAGLCSGPNRKRCRRSLRRALPPQCKTPRPIPHRKERIERRVKVGRAVNGAPGWVMQTRPLLGWNPAVRALTGAVTLTCGAVAAVCDRPGFLVIHLRNHLATPMLGKNGRRS